jgi:hypothetical protein
MKIHFLLKILAIFYKLKDSQLIDNHNFIKNKTPQYKSVFEAFF